jgi:hypothetical protein
METIKLTEQEVQQIVSIQQKHRELIEDLGQIELLKIKIEKRRKQAEILFEQIEEEENIVATRLERLYGKGTIDLDKGEFTPLKEEEGE